VRCGEGTFSLKEPGDGFNGLTNLLSQHEGSFLCPAVNGRVFHKATSLNLTCHIFKLVCVRKHLLLSFHAKRSIKFSWEKSPFMYKGTHAIFSLKRVSLVFPRGSSGKS